MCTHPILELSHCFGSLNATDKTILHKYTGYSIVWHNVSFRVHLNIHFVAEVTTPDSVVMNITVFTLYWPHTALLQQIVFCFQPPEGHRGTVWQLCTWKETVTPALLLQYRFILATLWWIACHWRKRNFEFPTFFPFLTWPHDPGICPLTSGCLASDSHHSVSSLSREVCLTLSLWAGYKWFGLNGMSQRDKGSHCSGNKWLSDRRLMQVIVDGNLLLLCNGSDGWRGIILHHWPGIIYLFLFIFYSWGNI